MSRRTLTLSGVVLACTRPAAAHGGHAAGHRPWLPAALFLTGVAVLGASLYADETGRVQNRYVDAGVAVGLGVVVLAAATVALRATGA